MTRTRVSLVTLGDPGTQTGGYLYHRRLADAAPRHGAEMSFVSFPERPFPLPAWSGRSVMARASNADAVVIDSIAAAFAAPWLGRAARPVIGMLHQPPGGIDHGPVRARLQGWLDRRAYARMRGLLVASESLAAEVRGLHDCVRVVAPGRDVASEPAGDVGDLRRGRPAALLCVGNWIPRKGIVELVEAFALLPDDVATLHLVGDDGVDSQYRAAVRRRLGGLDDRVVVHGVVSKERIASLYRAADVFVMPSFKEPYGTVYGEAMAAGLPVVGWRAGNLPFLVEHGREGFVVEPGDVAGLADALLRLSRDSARRADMAAAASARGARLPTWEDTAAKFFESVRDLLAGA